MITLKRGDTYPPLVMNVAAGETAIDLTAAEEVRVIIKMEGGEGIALGPADITDAENGEITYEWSVGDTDIAGTYQTEVEILWAAGGVQTVPNDGYGIIVIMADLGGVSPVAA